MFILLNLGWILFWGLAYVLLVRRGFLDQTFGFPFIAICTDLSWVLIFTFVYPQSPFMLLFLVVDLIFLYQLVRFRGSDFLSLSKAKYLGAVALGLITSFALILAFTVEFGDRHGVYSSFADTLLASILFVVLIRRRNSVRGQSLYIALAKMLGTLSAVIAYNFFVPPALPPRLGLHFFHWALNIPIQLSPDPVPSYIGSVLLAVLGIAIFGYDVLYIGLIYRQCRREGINPWRRL